MKKKILIYLSLFVVLTIALFYSIKSNAKVNLSATDQITIVSLLSPPQQKILTKQTDIDQLRELLNGIQRKYQIHLKNPKSWVILIKADNQEILISEGYMILHGDYYAISSQDEMKVIDFYNSLDLMQKTYTQ